MTSMIICEYCGVRAFSPHKPSCTRPRIVPHETLIAADAIAASLSDFVAWAEGYRAECKRAGERPAIDAHRVNRAKAALKKAGRR